MKKLLPKILLRHGVWCVESYRLRMNYTHIRDARRYADKLNREQYRGKYSVLGMGQARDRYLKSIVFPLLGGGTLAANDLVDIRNQVKLIKARQ